MGKKQGLGLKELIRLNSTTIVEETESKIKLENDFLYSEVYLNSIDALKKGNLMEALEGFSAIVFFDNENLKALINLGVIYYELGIIDYAKNKFKKVLELDPNNKIAKQNLDLLEED